MSDDKRTALRRTDIGFVYQFHHLLPEFSALENLVLPQMIAGLPRDQAAARARELLAYLGLAERESHRPAELSGGEQQRVAIARAVANSPRVLLADEPTGNLDPKTADHVFGTLAALVRASGLAALVATHNWTSPPAWTAGSRSATGRSARWPEALGPAHRPRIFAKASSARARASP